MFEVSHPFFWRFDGFFAAFVALPARYRQDCLKAG
jgi:hypothetical protein